MLGPGSDRFRGQLLAASNVYMYAAEKGRISGVGESKRPLGQPAFSDIWRGGSRLTAISSKVISYVSRAIPSSALPSTSVIRTAEKSRCWVGVLPLIPAVGVSAESPCWAWGRGRSSMRKCSGGDSSILLLPLFC
jgi:hypothetical protein